MNLSPLRIIINGVDEYSKQFGTVSKEAKKMGASLTSIGSTLTTAVTLPLTLAAGAAIFAMNLGLEYARSCARRQNKLDFAEISSLYVDMRRHAREDFARIGIAESQLAYKATVEMRYVGQFHEVEIETVSIRERTSRRTSSGLPKGKVDCVPMVPQNDSRSPYALLSATGSMHSGWIGLRMSTPISMRSGMIAETSPSLW